MSDDSTQDKYWQPYDDMLAEGACQVCHGSGVAFDENDEESECWNCGGSGDAEDGDYEFGCD